ncbi:MAG: DNA-binding protein [Acidobacteria bacterium]|nr:MAG: DNA-binding protein [Acidobacteriota bacterium]
MRWSSAPTASPTWRISSESTPSHIWRLCQRGDIASIRLGGRILIPREEVDRILSPPKQRETGRGGRW